MVKKKKQAYKGVLAVPMQFGVSPFPPSGRRYEASRAYVQERNDAYEMALSQRVCALFVHYGIQDGDYPALAMALAQQHVPGFAIAKGSSGAKTKWDAFETALLRVHIDVIQTERNKRFAEAARIAARSERWASKVRKDSTNLGETLRRRAETADRELVTAYLSAFHFARKHNPKLTISEFAETYLTQPPPF
jgi:hypothetical protein